MPFLREINYKSYETFLKNPIVLIGLLRTMKFRLFLIFLGKFGPGHYKIYCELFGDGRPGFQRHQIFGWNKQDEMFERYESEEGI